MPELYFEHLTPSGEGIQEFSLSIRCFASAFHIRYSGQNISAPGLFEKLLTLSNDYDERGDPSAINELIKPFKSQIENLASSHQSYLLSDYLYPRYFVLKATAGPEDAEISPQLGERKNFLPGDSTDRWQELEHLSTWVANVYPSRRVMLPPPPEQDTRLSGPGKVFVDGNPYFFKKWLQFASSPGANLTELRTYKQVQEAISSGRIRPDLPICRLHGVVLDTEDETPRDGDMKRSTIPPRLVGILLTYIETKKPRRMGTLLHKLRGGGCSLEIRSRWARELDDCIAELHGAGIVWGDAKPENILVDGYENIWVTDFGGSYTDGWVDKNKAGTLEGDLQGVAKIKEFLYSSK